MNTETFLLDKDQKLRASSKFQAGYVCNEWGSLLHLHVRVHFLLASTR